MKTMLTAFLFIMIAATASTFGICMTYEMKIKARLKELGITDKTDQFLMAALPMFGQFLSDYEGQVTDIDVQKDIAQYKKYIKVFAVMVVLTFVTLIVHTIE